MRLEDFTSGVLNLDFHLYFRVWEEREECDKEDQRWKRYEELMISMYSVSVKMGERSSGIRGSFAGEVVVGRDEKEVSEIMGVLYQVALARGLLYRGSSYELQVRVENLGTYFLVFTDGRLSVLTPSPGTDFLLVSLLHAYGSLIQRLDLYNEHLGESGSKALVHVLLTSNIRELGLVNPTFLKYLPSNTLTTLHVLNTDHSQNFLQPALEEHDPPCLLPLAIPTLYAQNIKGLATILRFFPFLRSVGYVVRSNYTSSTRFRTLSSRVLESSELTGPEITLLSQVQRQVPGTLIIPYFEEREPI